VIAGARLRAGAEVAYPAAVATYEFRCRTCDTTFEERRAMAQADAPAPCPVGHADTVRLLSVFATVSAGGGSPAFAPSGGGGGCCGGACGCG
jgi:putative FmdB family regulatory protein